MKFEDAVFVRLANPDTRAAVFDETSLKQLTSAAYDASSLALEGPFAPVFEEFRPGFSDEPPAILDGAWNRTGGGERTELRIALQGLGLAPAGADAMWRGAVSGHGVPASGLIADVESVWAPDLVDGRGAGGATGTVTVQFTQTSTPTPVPVILPLTALILIRDAGLSVRDLLAESNALRNRLQGSGLQRPAEASLPGRFPIIVVWIVPQTVFDDPDWPGGTGGSSTADRDARRQAAGQWLATEGIGLVAVGQ